MSAQENSVLCELDSWISVFKPYRELMHGPVLCHSDCLHLLEVLEEARDLIKAKQSNT